MTAPRARHPARVLHRCCANAAANLVGHVLRSFDEKRYPYGTYSWKLITEPRVHTYPPQPGRMLSIIFCPWCGCNLEAWRVERPNPLQPHAETLEESDQFLNNVLREIRSRS